MKPLNTPALLKLRDAHPVLGYGDDEGGYFLVTMNGKIFTVIASVGGGWDHVSVSAPDRCPTWLEMDSIKRMFFRDDECVMQLHPPKSDHINCHNFCLHLWRPQSASIPRPPGWMVA